MNHYIPTYVYFNSSHFNIYVSMNLWIIIKLNINVNIMLIILKIQNTINGEGHNNYYFYHVRWWMAKIIQWIVDDFLKIIGNHKYKLPDALNEFRGENIHLSSTTWCSELGPRITNMYMVNPVRIFMIKIQILRYVKVSNYSSKYKVHYYFNTSSAYLSSTKNGTLLKNAR